MEESANDLLAPTLMGNYIALPPWLQNSIAGVLILFSLRLVWNLAQGILKRQKIEGGIDERSAKQVDTALRIAEDARSDAAAARDERNKLAQDLTAANSAYIEMSQTFTTRHASELERLRGDIGMLNGRLEGCEQRHAAAEQRQAATEQDRDGCEARLEEMRNWVVDQLGAHKGRRRKDNTRVARSKVTKKVAKRK